MIFHGRTFDDARKHAEQLSREEGCRYIHSANEPALIAGVGTYTLETIQKLSDVDVIIVPVGGGSGALFTIAKGGQLELLADLSEDDLSSISVGVTAQVTPVGTDKVFTGQVWQLSPVIDPQSRQGTARIALDYDPALRPGGFASVKISSGTVVAPMLPESAIQNDAKGAFVYTIDDKGIVHRKPVKTGMVTGQGIAVTSGLSGTERVVLRAGGFLNDGDKVKAKLVSGEE